MAAIFEQKIWRRHRLCAHLDSMTRWTRLSLQLHSAASYSLPTILPSLLLFTVFKIVFFSFTFSLILICSFLGKSLAPIRRKMQLRIRLHSTRTRRCNALAAHRVPPDDRAARDALQHCTLVFAIIYCHCHEIQHLVFRPFMFGL